MTTYHHPPARDHSTPQGRAVHTSNSPTSHHTPTCQTRDPKRRGRGHLCRRSPPGGGGSGAGAGSVGPRGAGLFRGGVIRVRVGWTAVGMAAVEVGRLGVAPGWWRAGEAKKQEVAGFLGLPWGGSCSFGGIRGIEPRRYTVGWGRGWVLLRAGRSGPAGSSWSWG